MDFIVLATATKHGHIMPTPSQPVIVLAGEAANTNFLSLALHDLPHLE